ncbi:MAG: acyltransferase [Acidobacteria bacterium]|nr:acyltransferase [Acidobacteriota bacterium]
MSRADSYRPDIDGLRAVAVVLVILFHATPGLLPGGFIGVDVFFVISGYLITSIILREISDGAFTLRSFYARRCRRILPALVVVLTATWAIGRATLTATDFQFVGKHILGGATFTSNILLWRETGYFDIAAGRKPLLHLWSLGVEEQFYLVWPPLAMLAVIRRWRPLWLSAILLTGSLILAIALSPAQGDATFYLLPTRMWELLVGAVLVQMEWRSDAPADPTASSGVWREARAVIGLLLIFAVCLFDPGTGRARLAWLVAPVAGAALLISARGAWINRQLLARRAIVWIGLISYPLYLWHWPLLSMVTLLAGQTTMQQLAVLKAGAVTLAFVLSALTWRWVELPVRRLATETAARPRRNVQVLAVSAGVLIAMSGAGAWTWDRSRPSEDTIAADEPLRDATVLFPDADYRRMSTRESVVVLVGDSHSNHLLPGLVPEARRHGFGVSYVGLPGCTGVTLATRIWGPPDMFERCQTLADATLSRFVPDPAAKVFVFAVRGGLYSVGTDSSDATSGHPWVELPSETRQRVLYEGYSAAMTRIERAGKRVALVQDVPELGFDPHYCEARLATAKFLGNECSIARETVDDRQRAYRRVVARLRQAHPQLAVFDPLPLLCDRRWCYAKRNGQIMYRDPTHLSAAGSAMVAESLGKILFRP